MIQTFTFRHDGVDVVVLVDIERCNWAQYAANPAALLNLRVRDLYGLGVVILPATVYNSVRHQIIQYCTHGEVFDIAEYHNMHQGIFDSMRDAIDPMIPIPSPGPYTINQDIFPIDYGVSPIERSPTVSYINYHPESTTPKDDVDE